MEAGRVHRFLISVSDVKIARPQAGDTSCIAGFAIISASLKDQRLNRCQLQRSGPDLAHLPLRWLFGVLVKDQVSLVGDTIRYIYRGGQVRTATRLNCSTNSTDSSEDQEKIRN